MMLKPRARGLARGTQGLRHIPEERYNPRCPSGLDMRNFRLTLSYDLQHVIDAGRNQLKRTSHQNI